MTSEYGHTIVTVINHGFHLRFVKDSFTVLGWTVSKIGTLFGVLLTIIGIISYFIQSADHPSITALIPSAFGVPMAAMGILAVQNSQNRHHYMHASMVLALLMVLGGARVIFSFTTMSTLAIFSHLALFFVGMSFTIIGILSFRHARMLREAGELEG